MKIVTPFLTITMVLLLATQTSLVAQTNNTSDYLVLIAGDTLYGTVKHINQSGLNPRYYKKIRFMDTNGKRRKYKRKDVSAFRVNHTNYEGFWLNQSSQKIVLLNPKYDIDPQNGEKYFLKVLSKGKLSHYELEWWEQGEPELSWMDLLKKEEDGFFMRATQGLLGLKRKVLANYFLNCPDLMEKIKQKELNKVWEVADFYNSNCKS
ncbi:MAG: hypothetical protein WBG90_15285 [Saonia sp.]